MVCALDEETRFVRSVDACVLCDGSSQAVLYVALALCLSLCVGAVVFISWNDGPSRKKWSKGLGIFAEKIQTKYKILVTFTQVLFVRSLIIGPVMTHPQPFRFRVDSVQSCDTVPHGASCDVQISLETLGLPLI